MLSRTEGTSSWQGTVRLLLVVVVAALLSACAHSITINPATTPQRKSEAPYSSKVAGYVLTDVDRLKEVTTPGGGGDKVSYFPYKDLERGLRDALKAVYADVVLLGSVSDYEAFKRDGVGIVFTPQIVTTSYSDSAFTWPPTQFGVEISSTVTDPTGKFLGQVRAAGQGTATFSEFKNDFGLAARRASQDAIERLVKEIMANPQLK